MRVFDFVFASFLRLDRDLATLKTNVFVPILDVLSAGSLADEKLEKWLLFGMLLHSLMHVHAKQEIEGIAAEFNTIFATLPQARQVLLGCFCKFVTVFNGPETISENK